MIQMLYDETDYKTYTREEMDKFSIGELMDIIEVLQSENEALKGGTQRIFNNTADLEVK